MLTIEILLQRTVYRVTLEVIDFRMHIRDRALIVLLLL